MKKILVIGANGFLGTHLTKAFSKMGDEVVALVGKGTDFSSVSNIENVICIEFSLGKFKEVTNLIPEGISTAYILAWVGVSSSVKNECDLQTQNISYMMEIMECLDALNIKRVIVPGSASEFACSDAVITGYNAPAPSDFYSAAKISARYLCGVYAKTHNMEFIWTLISSIYGPGRRDSNLITYAICSLLKGESPEFTKLEQQWDYIYIDDAIEALTELQDKGIDGKMYPIGSGVSKPLSEYVSIIHNLIAPDVPLKIGALPYKTSIIDNQIMDISQIVQDIGFKPKYSFAEGISQTIEYFRENIDR
ncbi:dTDP-glucose 4,6-dehydratase [Sporomusa ovata DSM 2662]|uniref:UDP-glucose 4-epimerase n=1 Tax=Sporomusa ovata TaxID=2378 RepID=A0A0U1KSX2_9FIRM|nr:NAD(P)-dependent oxidoreductase [Sporomusa ovata]EQB26438.1 nucleoside-diphosphate-sugar epimerase [Sporomusa ovata DSM 2662]CQR70522.1 UDP-glucose 4-epimerase [Sporomusa ovata]